jgi:hypothetical protein
MTAARRETRLLELVKQWREEVALLRKRSTAESLGSLQIVAITALANGYDTCADELEAALREAAALQLEICPWCNKPVQPGTSAFNRSHWPSCPKDAKGGEALGRVPPAYDLEHEVGRVIEALDLKGATMTVRCAMQEAYQAGVASARQESE